MTETQSQSPPMLPWYVVPLMPLVALGLVGCCGISAVHTPADAGGPAAATVTESGVVLFTPETVGTQVLFDLPVHESADTDETILSASLQGAAEDSFAVLSPFPFLVPDGEEVFVRVQFAPKSVGTLTAELRLETEKMGVSTIPLSGTGLAVANSDGT